ncbi:DUF6214 family protein [Streptomyces sp. NPDC059009]|uniref:DUF6214 family protein n=1 Tax=Streptomyces sp. NPDC059009 TaxID=3346694 RepID=UPI0036B9881C
MQGHGTASGGPSAAPAGEWGTDARDPFLPPWFHVRLTFGDGCAIDVLAVVSDGQISIEDFRSQPPLSLDEFAALADWIEGPLEDACRVVADQHAAAAYGDGGALGETGAGAPWPWRDDRCPQPQAVPRRARPAWPRGSAGRRIVAEAYRAAQEEGRDPVLAVMCATGRSRRKALRLIAGARDAGFLAPRHNRR